jgi:hypothetical protein
VQRLLELAAAIFKAVANTTELRLIGGLAVRLLVGSAARVTRDIDVVAMSDTAERAVIAYLESEGFAVGEAGAWKRAISMHPPRLIVDLLRHPIVTPRSFDTASFTREPELIDVAGVTIAVAAVDDIARLKLLAARDQDLVDLLMLASHRSVSAASVARAAEADDAERAVSAGAAIARHALESGEMEAIAEEALGRHVGRPELDALARLLAQLQQEAL